MSYDLILQAHPSEIPSRHLATAVAADMIGHPIIGALCEITPHHPGPTSIDTMVLDECLFDGQFTAMQFEQFCARNSLRQDTTDEVAAAAFLDSILGATLVGLKMPLTEDDVRRAYFEIVGYATKQNLRVVDPQLGRDIDLSSPGDLPPLWRQIQ